MSQLILTQCLERIRGLKCAELSAVGQHFLGVKVVLFYIYAYM